jgi:hypothetical protein
MVRGSHHLSDVGRGWLGIDGLELCAEVFLLAELRRNHLLQHFAISMAPFVAGAAVCQRDPAGLGIAGLSRPIFPIARDLILGLQVQTAKGLDLGWEDGNPGAIHSASSVRYSLQCREREREKERDM